MLHEIFIDWIDVLSRNIRQDCILPNTKLPRNEELSFIVAPPIKKFIFFAPFYFGFPLFSLFYIFAPFYFGFPLFSLFYILDCGPTYWKKIVPFYFGFPLFSLFYIVI